MQIAKELHRAMLLELIDKAHFPGSLVKEVFSLREEVEKAEITGEKGSPNVDESKAASA